jgi:hypothetical protein
LNVIPAMTMGQAIVQGAREETRERTGQAGDQQPDVAFGDIGAGCHPPERDR